MNRKRGIELQKRESHEQEPPARRVKIFFLLERISGGKDQRFLFALFVLMLVSSLFQGMKAPVANAAPYNFIILGTSLLILVVSITELSEVWAEYKPLVIFCTLLFLWFFVAAFFSPFRDSIIKYPFKYSQVYFYFLAMLCYARHRELGLPSFRFIYRFMVGLAVIAALEKLFHHEMLAFLMLFRSEASLEVFPRVAGLMMWPNQFGVLSALAIALGAILFKKGSLRRTELIICTFFLLLAISLSGSRNAWLNTAIAFLLCWPFKAMDFKRLVAAAAVWTILMFGFAVPTHQLGVEKNPYVPLSKHIIHIFGGEEDKTIEQMPTPSRAAGIRKVRWAEGLRLWYDNPLTGAGRRGYSVNWERKHDLKNMNVDNLFLHIPVELGLGGSLLGLLTFLVYIRRIKWSEPLVTVPVVIFFTGQIVDCFIHDITFLVVYGFVLAAIKTNYDKSEV